jgi:hypothetical protein
MPLFVPENKLWLHLGKNWENAGYDSAVHSWLTHESTFMKANYTWLGLGENPQDTLRMENHHFWWVNPLFLWPCSIATLNYQRIPYSSILAISGGVPVNVPFKVWEKDRSLPFRKMLTGNEFITCQDLGAQVILQSHGKVHNHQKHTVADTTNHWIKTPYAPCGWNIYQDLPSKCLKCWSIFHACSIWDLGTIPNEVWIETP